MALKVLGLFALVVSLCGASPIYYLETGQTGAQTQIDVNHTSTWSFTPNISFDFGGGLFVMKDGSKTSAQLALSLFQGSDATGPLLGSAGLTHTEFCAEVTNCGQFKYHQFFLDTPIPLVSGMTYFAALTSAAADVQNQAYFIKSDTFVSDQNGTAIDPQPIGSNASAPEPDSIVLMGLGLLICGIAFRRGAHGRRAEAGACG